MNAPARPLSCWPFALAVALLALLPFLPALDNGFVWDDELNLTGNEHFGGLDAEHLRWMFTEAHAGHYQPLTWLSYSLNYELDGLNPRGYIAVNLALHALNAALVFLLFTRLLPAGNRPRWRLAWAALGALFYALHPLRVESVVWVTERRDVLSLCLLLLSLLAWLHAQSGGKRQRLFYALSLLLFAGSLLAKAWGIVYPAVLLILSLYPLRQRDRRRVLLKLVPFAGLAVAFALLAAWAQSEQAMATLSAHGPAARGLQAAWAPAFYLGKTLLPLDLSPLYLLKANFSPWAPDILIGGAITLALTLLLIVQRRRHPALLAGWLVFLVLLAPVSGLAQSGSQLAADRYTYLAGIVLGLAFATAGLWASNRWPVLRKGLALAAVLILGLLALRTTQQSQVWHNADTLWTQAISADKTNYVAYFNRASAGKRGGYEGRMLDLDRAIELDPKYASAYALRGKLYLDAGLSAKALSDLDRAITLNPTPAQPYNNRGILRMNAGDATGARADFTAALERDPELYEAYVNRGLLNQRSGRLHDALDDYSAALALRPRLWQVYFNRGLLRAQAGRNKAAVEDFTHALSINPEFAGTYEQRALLYKKLGQDSAAEADLATAQRLKNSPETNKP